MATNPNGTFGLRADENQKHEDTMQSSIGSIFGCWSGWQLLLMVVLLAATYDQGMMLTTIRSSTLTAADPPKQCI